MSSFSQGSRRSRCRSCTVPPRSAPWGTLVMHPVDTFKTLQITAAKAAEAEARPRQSRRSSNHRRSRRSESRRLRCLRCRSYTTDCCPTSSRGALLRALPGHLRAGALRPHGTRSTVRERASAHIPGRRRRGQFVGSIIRAAEATKCRVQSGLASSPAEAFGQVLDKPSQLFTAWSSSLWRDVPMGAVQIAVLN